MVMVTVVSTAIVVVVITVIFIAVFLFCLDVNQSSFHILSSKAIISGLFIHRAYYNDVVLSIVDMFICRMLIKSTLSTTRAGHLSCWPHNVTAMRL